MRKRRQAPLSAVLVVAVGAAAAGALPLDDTGLIQSAQAQPEEEKKKRREQERQKAAPPRPQPSPGRPAQEFKRQRPPERPAQEFKRQRPPERPAQEFKKQRPPERPAQQFQRQPAPERPAQEFKRQPAPERPAQEFKKQRPPERPAQEFKRQRPPERPAQQFQRQPAPERPAQEFKRQRPPERPAQQFQRQPAPERPAQPHQQPPAAKSFSPTKPAAAPPPDLKKDDGRPPATSGPARPQSATPSPRPGPFGPQGAAVKRFDDVRRLRKERAENGGRRKVIEEPGGLFIVKEGNRIIVRHDDSERFKRRPGAKSQRRPDGNVETFYVRRDGVRIVTVCDANGRLLRRFRRYGDGRERNIIDNRRFYRNLAIGAGLAIIALNLPPPRVTIPHDEYIVDYDSASDDDLYETLDAPPVEDLDRPYALEEIRHNHELLARVRSIDIDTIHFDSGAWEVTPDQYGNLERIARAILRVLERNPDAVFMIAGHTDAVGPEDENASLADRRASAVAEVLTEQFDVPAENLVTQGYGEQYLKIDTQEPEPRNRRVSVHNVTALMAER